MFAYIKGILASKSNSLAVVDVNGVGYKIFSSQKCLDELETGQEAKLHIHASIKEDAFDLIGFTDEFELNIFELLISVNGVGTKAALAILSAMTAVEFTSACISGNSKAITAAQGVGAKLAQRIIMELKDKLAKQGVGVVDLPLQSTSTNLDEATAALVSLGYSPMEAKRAICSTTPNANVEQVILESLAFLQKK